MMLFTGLVGSPGEDKGSSARQQTSIKLMYNACSLGVPPGSVDCGKELSFLEFMFTGTVRPFVCKGFKYASHDILPHTTLDVWMLQGSAPQYGPALRISRGACVLS